MVLLMLQGISKGLYLPLKDASLTDGGWPSNDRNENTNSELRESPMIKKRVKFNFDAV